MNLKPTLPKFSRKSWTIITTIAIIAACYAYYFFVFIVQNEQRLNEKSYRTLNLISENINEKYINLTKLAKFSAQQPPNYEVKDVLDSLYEIEDSIWDAQDEIYFLLDSLAERKDSSNLSPSLRDSLKSIDEYYESIIPQLEQLEEIERVTNSSNQFLIQLNKKLSSLAIEASLATPTHKSKAISFTDSALVDGKYTNLTFEITYKDFLSSLLQLSVFDEYIIVNGSSQQMLFQTFEDQVRSRQIKTCLENKTCEGDTCTETLTSGGVSYKPYLFNMNFRDGDDWVIMGFVNAGDYNKRVKQINVWVILIAALTILILVLVMPVLKLSLMNEIERLHIRNVVLTGMSLVIGAPLILLVALVLFYFSGNDLKIVDKRLGDLSEQIISGFTNEMEQVRTQLSIYDQKRLNYNEEENPNARNGQIVFKEDSIELSIYSKYNEIFWMDADGYQMEMLEPSDFNRVKVNREGERFDLASREYFSNVMENRLWGNDSSKMMAFQSIISWITNKKEVAISLPGKVPGYPVVAMTSKMQSVIDVVVPLGYGFFIIDQTGKVLLQTDKEKNLQENLIDETNRSQNLRSAIIANIDLYFSEDYLDNQSRMFIRPIKDTPFFMVTQYDMEMLRTRIFETWLLTLYLLIFGFTCLGVLIGLMLFHRYRRSNLKIQRFYFDWLSPRDDQRKKYDKIIVASGVTIALMILFNEFLANRIVDVISITVFTPALLFAYVYLSLNEGNRIIRKHFLLGSIGVFLLYNVIGCFYFDTTGWPLIYQLTLFGFFLIQAKAKYMNLFANTRQSYSVALFCWLIASSLIPILYYYKVAYAHESNIWSRHALLDLKEQLVKKNENSFVDDKNGNYLLFVNDSIQNNLEEEKSDANFHRILYQAMPSFTDLTVVNKGLAYPSSSNSPFSWGTLEHSKDLIALTYKDKNLSKRYLTTTVDKISAVTLIPRLGLYALMVLVYALFLFVVFRIIRFSLSKIYLWDIRFEKVTERFAKGWIKPILKSKMNLQVIGLPNSGKTSSLKREFEKDEMPLRGDCVLINHKEKWDEFVQMARHEGKKIIIIDNFEYQIQSHDTNKKKLHLLEELVALGKQIIIVTELHLSAIPEFYQKNIESSTDEQLKKEYRQHIGVWRKITGGFVDFYMPLKDNIKKESTKGLDAELRYGGYLQNTNKIIKSSVLVDKDDQESIVLEIQEFAQSYYFALWNSLIREEKYAVYDLAKDTFINAKNEHVIVSLQKKGIFVYHENGMKFMNLSFANFVLEVVNAEDTLAMEKDVKKKGKWSTVKEVIVLVIISLMILVGFGQPDFFDNINSIVLALTGIIGVLPTISNLFSFGKKLGG